MSLKKYGLLGCIILIIGILSISIILMIPNIKLFGSEEVFLDVYQDYKEEGYTATFLFKDVSKKVVINNKVNKSKLGKYEVIYSLDIDGFKVKKKRIVNVVDKEEPVISMLGQADSYVCPGTEYVEEGYEVTDNYDSDLNDKVSIEKKENKIIYAVTDSSGNKGISERTIIYQDIEKPVITLSGNSEMSIYVGSTYREPGFNATDNCDGDITSKVVVSGSVNRDVIGTYELVYTVTDNSGNEVSVTRKVNVIKNYNVVSGVGKKIFLTFDDGPSATITPSVLQILREEGVKATFFVINKSDSLNYLIKQAYDEGHTIALHSNTHNYAYIYSSIDNYFADLNAINNKVESITGVKSKIIRFPGGGSNTVSRNYQVGIMTTLTQMVVDRGYNYFDWNVASGDAGGARTEYDVYNNVVNNLKYQNNIVLLHDFENNYKTLNALRDIIRYGKEHGYTFEAIKYDTPPSRHRVNN